MRILVAGATGVLGRRTIPHLRAAGHTIVGTARNENRARVVRGLGAEPFLADILDPEAVSLAAAGCEAVLHLATRIPRGTRTAEADWTENDRIRIEGTRHLLAAARAAGARYYLQQSITFIYGDHGDEWIDESTPVSEEQPAPLQSTLEMERLVRDSGLSHVILRGGTFYGSGTGFTETMLEMLRKGRWPVIGSGEAFTSLIHVEDMARAAAAAVDRRLEGLLNVVDTEPVRQRDLLRFAAARFGARAPRRMATWLARLVARPRGSIATRSQRVSSVRLREALVFSFAYPTYREGLAEVQDG